MKAVVYQKYGSPDVLELREVDRPVLRENEVIVKVHASSLNAADLDQLKGAFFVRMGAPFRPKNKILGSDIAGRIETVGGGVTGFKTGDEVYADLTDFGFGAFSEYVSVPETALALKPVNTTFEEAAAVPSAGGVALLNLQAKGRIQPGQQVLINGAGGGMGTFAVQIAKSQGAEVTGVDTGEKLDTLLSIGADHVVDYTKEDFTTGPRRYDLILDVAAHRSISDYKRALNSNGAFVFVGGSTAILLRALLMAPRILKSEGKDFGPVMSYPTAKELQLLREFVESGKVTPVIDRRYPLSEIATAFRYLQGGRVRGKLVITMGKVDT